MTQACDVRLRVLSLGAGVQSTTVALLAARGEIDVPDVAIFADTQWEPAAVYRQVGWLRSVLPYPVHAVTIGSIRENILARRNAAGGRFASVPWYIRHEDGSEGMGRRQCTREYKLDPIRREIRRMLGAPPRSRIAPNSVEVLIGISTDEATRMKPARQRWLRNRWPLVELGMSRSDCVLWLTRNGYPTPPKSSCIGCPFHHDSLWREMRANAPEEWADAVEMDRALRQGDARGMRGTEFMHRSCVPLDQVDLSTAEERGQLNLFESECEGICGV